jgi:hypothetical protein
MRMEHPLPQEIADGSCLSENEYAWDLLSFPTALTRAENLRYACIGGQFQFRLDSGICEMYWLSADSGSRQPEETWIEYCRRSCIEVRQGFERLASETDFHKQAREWQPVREAMAEGLDPAQRLVFVAYFVNEEEWLEDQQRKIGRQAP